MGTYNYECVRSHRSEHQCNGLRAVYFISGSVEAGSMKNAKETIEPNLAMFMRAIPGVFTLTIKAARSQKAWEYDTRPKLASRVLPSNSGET